MANEASQVFALAVKAGHDKKFSLKKYLVETDGKTEEEAASLIEAIASQTQEALGR